MNKHADQPERVLEFRVERPS
eukprot:COSAG04_NODE_13039_length_623_cov_0.677481_2_plen_20_part_01